MTRSTTRLLGALSFVTATLAALASFGCAASSYQLTVPQMQEFSTGRAGDCTPAEFEISNYTPSQTGSYCGTWIATCHGTAYTCNRSPDGRGGGTIACVQRTSGN